MIEITAEDIADLADDDLRSLVARLCEAQLRFAGLPASAVTWGGDQDAPDGGIDVRVALPKATIIEGFVPRPATGFQVKKPDMPRNAILKEMRPANRIRPVIQELAQQSGAYIIVSSSGSTSDSALQKREQAMAEAVRDVQGAEALKLHFYDRTRLATWVRDHPGLIPWVRERIGKAIPGWRSYGPWAYAPDGVSGEYLIDATARIHTSIKEDGKGLSAVDGLQRIRDLLCTEGKCVRLVGHAGVGKTRLVQALFDERIGGQSLDPSLALYANMADDPNPPPVGLASDLIVARTRAILVIDNCPSDLHRRLSEVCRSLGSTLSVVTVEYDIREDESEGTEVFELQPSSVELAATLVSNRFPEVSLTDARTVAEFSGGNARIAIALAGTIGKGDTIAGLKDEDLFRRLFRQRHEDDGSLLTAAQVCSLVYSFQGEDISGQDAELPRLGALIGKSAEELFGHVAELRRRDLAQKRSVWRAVLPPAIANRLAAAALQNIPSEMIEKQLVNGAPARLLKSFSRRLGFLHSSPEAVRIVDRWLGVDGLLGEVRRLDDLGRAMFTNVAPVAPSAALKALERAISGAQIDQILPNCADYVHLLRSIAYEPEQFDRSVAVLINLAVVELANDPDCRAFNAFKSLFYLHMSGTHASIEQRLLVIGGLLKRDDSRYQKLGLAALDAALETWQFSSSYGFQFGGRSRDFGYMPRTREQNQHWYSTALWLVETIACSDLAVSEQVCELLAKKFRGLWTKAQMYDDLDRIARAISAEQSWRDGWFSIRKTLKFDSRKFAPKVKSRLVSLEKMLGPTDLKQQVRFRVLSTTFNSLDLTDCEDDAPDDAITISDGGEADAENLGKLTAKDGQVFEELIPELFSSEGHLFSFGRGLAKGALNPGATWKSMVAHLGLAADGRRNVATLCGFMDALREIDAGLSAALLDNSVEHEVLARWFPLLQMRVPIDAAGIFRLKRSLAIDKAPIWMFKHLACGKYLDTVPGTDLKALVQLIAAKPDGYDPALEILYMRLYADKRNNRGHSPEVIEAGRDLMMHLEIGRGQRQPDRRLGDVAHMCLAGEGGGDVTRHICRSLKQAIARHKTSTDVFRHLVSALLTAQPLPSLDELFSGSDPERRAGLKIIAAKSAGLGNPLDAVGEDALLEWCDQDPASRYPTIASAISIFHKPDDNAPLQWTTLACRVLKKAPDSIEVLAEFARRFRPMSWSGSRASIMEERAQVLGQLDASFGPQVVDFARTELTRLNDEIEAERKFETDHDRKTDERFE